MAVALKKRWLNCTIWLPHPVDDPRIRHNYPVAEKYTVQFLIKALEDLDAELKARLCEAYFYLEVG